MILCKAVRITTICGLNAHSFSAGMKEEGLPMMNHNRDEAPPPVRNRRQSAIDRAARLVDIHHAVLHVPNELVSTTSEYAHQQSALRRVISFDHCAERQRV